MRICLVDHIIPLIHCRFDKIWTLFASIATGITYVVSFRFAVQLRLLRARSGFDLMVWISPLGRALTPMATLL